MTKEEKEKINMNYKDMWDKLFEIVNNTCNSEERVSRRIAYRGVLWLMDKVENDEFARWVEEVQNDKKC